MDDAPATELDASVLGLLSDAFGTDDDARVAWTQTSLQVKARCVAYVAAAPPGRQRAARAAEVHRLAQDGPIVEAGPGLAERLGPPVWGFGGLLQPPC